MLSNKNNITSITIGGFDGMHKAHQELFSSLDKNSAIIVIDAGYASLTPNTQRELYSTYDIYYYALSSIKHLEGKEFITLLEKEFPSLKKIVVGFDFHFGKDRKYDISSLKQMFKYEVEVIKEVKINNIAVHSRVIREYIKEGNIKTANSLLGRFYEIQGSQIKGQGLGSKSFVPTINLSIETYTLPNEGVYITKTILDNIEYESVTFLGHRVTTDGSYAVETHILNKDIVNLKDEVAIRFISKIRDNEKFDSFEELKEKINNDISKAKEYFLSKITL